MKSIKSYILRPLAALLLLALVLCGCEQFHLPTQTNPSYVPITTDPTTKPATQPTTESTTAPTEPTTVPTEPPTQPPTEPETIPTEPTTMPTEPYSSTNITIGSYIPGIQAKKAFVYDCETKTYLYMKSEADAKLYPASITKLMNVYTALKILDLNTVVTIDENTMSIVPSDTSKAALKAGESLTVKNLIYATLICSGSDGAHALAVAAARKLYNNPMLPAAEAEALFAEEMNKQAQSLGLVNTHFTNCDGYTDYYHYTCMADLVTIASVCLETPMIRDTVRLNSVRMYYADGRRRTLYSTNYLLKTKSVYYRAEAVGMKTGTTDAAGACLLSAYYVNGRYMLIGVFQCPTYNSRYDAATKLFDTFKNHGMPDPDPEPDLPTDPSTEPSTAPSTEPTTIPAEPTTIPTEPTTIPAEPTTIPTEPTTIPAEPTTIPAEPTTIPSEPSSESETEPSSEP